MSESQIEKQGIKSRKYTRNTFILDGHNGAALVEPVLKKLGWAKIQDRNSDDFRLKWTEFVSHINYGKFKEGEQLVNHIPNCGMITNKLGLLTSLRSYDKFIMESKKNKSLDMNMFVPETYIIDDVNEREQFFKTYKVGEIWINKPTGLNQGKGITLVRDIDEFRKDLDDRDIESRSSITGVKARIVQRYLSNPLLLHGRKFDIRSYMYIASTSPFLVLFCPGYIRLSMNRYSNEDTDLITHLTNQYIQKQSPNYGDVKEDTIWSMDKFNEYLNSEYDNVSEYKHDWAKTTLDKQMQQIMLYVFNAVKRKMAARIGFFEIFGFDFMVDANFKTWLIEVNVNPALHINCALLKEILPAMIEEVILLALECFEKCTKSKKSLVPLDNAKLFIVLYSESMALFKNRITGYSSLKSWMPPMFRTHSLSPNRKKAEERSAIERTNTILPFYGVVMSRFPSSLPSTRDVTFEKTLRNYKISDRLAQRQFLAHRHARSKSYNPISSERSDNIFIQNPKLVTRREIVEKSAPVKRKDSNLNTTLANDTVTLAPMKPKTDLFKPRRSDNNIRKTQSVQVKGPHPISLVQFLSGKRSSDSCDSVAGKVNMLDSTVKKPIKVCDRGI